MVTHRYFGIFCLLATIAGCGGSSGGGSSCADLDCQTSKYNLLVADIDGSNIQVIKTSSWQDMTHARASPDKNWVAYTTYNTKNGDGCATTDAPRHNSEIRVVRMDGATDKSVIAPVASELNSNNYWYGSANEFTFLSNTGGTLKLYRAQLDSSMNLIVGPTEIPIAGTITPVDPAADAGTGKIVYGGTWNDGTGDVKSIFIMDIATGNNLYGISLGSDYVGATIYGATKVYENDPKISPNGDKVAFMRYAPPTNTDSFGWHLFTVPAASTGPSETDISKIDLGTSLDEHDTLPEWIDNNTLVFSHMVLSTDAREIYTINDDGTGRTRVNLPTGYRYADVFPFMDGTQQKLLISAEKTSVSCQ